MLSEIFKAYDVRGIYRQNLNEEIVYKIGRAFVYFLKSRKSKGFPMMLENTRKRFSACKDVIVGTDMRISSPKISNAFMKGVAEQGANAIFIGQVCTDAVYFASGYLKKPAVMFTASHNPPQYNGIKFCKSDAIPINEDTGLQEIKSIAEKKQYETHENQRFSGHRKSKGFSRESKIKKHGKIIKKNILKEYVKHVRKFIDVKKLGKLKIAVDAGNGMSGKIIPLVYKNIPVKIIPLYFKLDGNFPNHPADPSKSENLVALQKTVKQNRCDFGMAFDGDADRIFFIDENGDVINSSLIASLIIKNLLIKSNRNEVSGELKTGKSKSFSGPENSLEFSRNQKFLSKLKQKIIYNVVCSHIVPETINQFHGSPIIERVGHSFIKETMRKTKALFACEHSAHYYYRDNYRADSGIITSLIVSEIVSKENKPISTLLKEFKKYYSIEETSIEVKNKDAKLKEIETLYKNQNPKKISKIDGITIEFGNWWFNVRPSNTEPLLRLNLEADSEELMREKKEEVLGIMSR